MRCKVISKTFCTNTMFKNELEIGECVQIERKFDRDGNAIIKVWQENYLGVLDDEDALEEWE